MVFQAKTDNHTAFRYSNKIDTCFIHRQHPGEENEKPNF